MKKFYKSSIYVSSLMGIIIAGLVALAVSLTTDDEIVGLFAREISEGSVVMMAFWVSLGFSNFLGSRFTIPKELDYIASSLPVFLLLPAMLVGVTTIVGAVILGSQSQWIMIDLCVGIGLMVSLVFAGAFLRGMAADDDDFRPLRNAIPLRRE